MTTKQIDIKNRTYYFYNDLINVKNFDPNMLKLDKKNSDNDLINIKNFDPNMLKLDKKKQCQIIVFIILVMLQKDRI